MVFFVASVPAFIFASLIWGQTGPEVVTAALAYPGLIVGLGAVVVSDLRQIGLAVIAPKNQRPHWLGVVLLLGRGVAFGGFVLAIANKEIKLVAHLLHGT